MKHLGDIPAAQTLDFKFNTHVNGTPTTLGGTPSLVVYKDAGTTQTSTGPTLNADFDGVTGLNHVRVDTTDAFYAAGSDYQVVIAAGTVDGNSVAGIVLAEFSIVHRKVALAPNQSITSLVVNNPSGHALRLISGNGQGHGLYITGGINGISITAQQNGLYVEGNAADNAYPSVYFAQAFGVTNGGSAFAVQNDSASYAAFSVVNTGAAGTGFYVEGGSKDVDADIAGVLAALSPTERTALANAVPTASAVAAAVMASTAANGVAASTILSRLNALAKGQVVPTDNGNGTYTLAFKAEDNTTTLFSITFNPTTGART